MSNDTRGWIMTCVSGIACVLGSSIICIDIVVRLFPGKKHFRIQDSNTFLSASLSLSAGVMLFSALYSMLPSSSQSFKKGGFSPQGAAWALIGCFLGGVVGIQIISKVLHHLIPSHQVDCDHTHEDDGHTSEHKHDAQGHHIEPHHKDHRHSHLHSHNYTHITNDRPPARMASESTPLLSSPQKMSSNSSLNGTSSRAEPILSPAMSAAARQSLQARLRDRIASFVQGEMTSCKYGRNGQCYGYSDPCGHECFKVLQSRNPENYPPSDDPAIRERRLLRSVTTPSPGRSVPQNPEMGGEQSEEHQEDHIANSNPTSEDSRTLLNAHADQDASSAEHESEVGGDPEADPQGQNHHHSQVHHHHVPENAFLSIGLQTSIAIALHKMPEGFITFATNHANPTLGFSVFMALFIHNITEGFALALPLYLALNSRWKAMFWSSLLGGVSQPLGAAVAAVWFKVANRGDMAPGEGIYGGMFAVTSGIMTSVALQLFSESLGLNHNRSLCMAFAFVGMGILGVSYALTAK
ncbi:MAG: nuclease [Chaenotheca gracillima]|nr:MAG: nuclease [Chaenotheca gracillima]